MNRINYYQRGRKFGQFLQNGLIGAQVAENPAVMTASGWKSDSQTGEWEQDPDAEGLEELRAKLVEIGVQGAATFGTEALISAAAKYAPKFLSSIAQKLGPKANRFYRTLTGETQKQAARVYQNADEMLSAAGKTTNGGLSTIPTANGSRMFVNGQGLFFDEAGNFLGTAAKGEYGGLFDAGMQNASQASNYANTLWNQGVNAQRTAMNAMRGASQATTDAAMIGAGTASGTAAGAMYLAGPPEQKRYGGIISYLNYMKL